MGNYPRIGHSESGNHAETYHPTEAGMSFRKGDVARMGFRYLFKQGEGNADQYDSDYLLDLPGADVGRPPWQQTTGPQNLPVARTFVSCRFLQLPQRPEPVDGRKHPNRDADQNFQKHERPSEEPLRRLLNGK